jgi:glutaredoxin
MEGYRQQGIAFEEIDLSLDAQTKAMVQSKYGAKKVPVIVEDGKLVQIGDKNGNG